MQSALRVVVTNEVGRGWSAGQRDQAERDQSTDKFRLFCRIAFGGSIIVEYGIIREVDESFAEIFGHTVEELCGRPLPRFLAASVPALRLDPGELSLLYEGPAVQKDGTAFYVSIACVELQAGQHILAARYVCRLDDPDTTVITSGLVHPLPA